MRVLAVAQVLDLLEREARRYGNTSSDSADRVVAVLHLDLREVGRRWRPRSGAVWRNAFCAK